MLLASSSPQVLRHHQVDQGAVLAVVLEDPGISPEVVQAEVLEAPDRAPAVVQAEVPEGADRAPAVVQAEAPVHQGQDGQDHRQIAHASLTRKDSEHGQRCLRAKVTRLKQSEKSSSNKA